MKYSIGSCNGLDKPLPELAMAQFTDAYIPDMPNQVSVNRVGGAVRFLVVDTIG